MRIRIRDTWREDHSYPRIHEIEVHRAEPNATLAVLKDSPIPDEKDSERFVLRRALGEKYVAPGTTFDEAKGYVHCVRAFLDTLIAEGTDRYGRVFSPMFASLLDLETHRIPEDIPANIEDLTSSFSQTIWQKITLVEYLTQSVPLEETSRAPK